MCKKKNYLGRPLFLVLISAHVDGGLMCETGMHMVVMGPDLGKQLVDAEKQFLQTADGLCHNVTIDNTLFIKR